MEFGEFGVRDLGTGGRNVDRFGKIVADGRPEFCGEGMSGIVDGVGEIGADWGICGWGKLWRMGGRNFVAKG